MGINELGNLGEVDKSSCEDLTSMSSSNVFQSSGSMHGGQRFGDGKQMGGQATISRPKKDPSGGIQGLR